MAKFMYAYSGGPGPEAMGEMPEEEIQKVMMAWQAWGETHNVPDLGAPFMGAKAVTADSVEEETGGPSGYSLVEATDMEDAISKTKDHPHLEMPGGKIVVHACGEM